MNQDVCGIEYMDLPSVIIIFFLLCKSLAVIENDSYLPKLLLVKEEAIIIYYELTQYMQNIYFTYCTSDISNIMISYR